MDRQQSLRVALLVMRLTLAVFFLVWVFQKILLPGAAQDVFSTFYLSTPPIWLIVLFGLVQAAFVLAFAAGLFKTITYGGLLVMHIASTAASWEKFLNPYSGTNILFWAAIPVLGALVALFLARDEDRMLTIGSGSGIGSG